MGVEVDARRICALALRSRAPATGHDIPVVVGLDGRSGTGKTTTAVAVAAALDAQTVHMDDLYPGWHGLADAVPVLVRDVLQPLCAGERAAYRRYDWLRQGYAERRVVEPGRFLVVEGCGCTTGAARAYTAVRVWLEAAPAVRRARGLDRDGVTFRPMWSMWRRQEDALFDTDDTRAHAHLVLHTD